MELNIQNVWIFFLIYSIAGWILESIYRSIIEKKIINSGFLNGPACPIYGVGAVIMLLFLSKFKDNIILLFIINFLVLSTWEYLVGVALEKIFKTKYWDYSDNKFNIHGRVCLFNSVCWGILGVIFIHFIHPFVVWALQQVNPGILKVTFIFISIVFVFDTIISVIKVKGLKGALEYIEKINEQIKEKIEEIKSLDKKENSKALEIKANLQETIKKLKKKKNRILRNLYRHVYRLKRAFPAIETKEVSEILNKKIEISKWKNNKKEKCEK